MEHHASTGPLSIIRADKDKPPLDTSEMTGSMILTTQPSVLADMLSDDTFVGQGLLSRTLIQCPLSELVLDDGREVETPIELIHRVEAYVYKVLSKRFNGKSPEENETVITCSPEAKEVFRKFQNYLDVTTLYLDDIKQFARRGREHAIRLAGFLASIREEQNINESVAKYAAELVLWHWSEVKDCYEDSGGSPVDAAAERAKDFIADNDGVVSLSELAHR